MNFSEGMIFQSEGEIHTFPRANHVSIGGQRSINFSEQIIFQSEDKRSINFSEQIMFQLDDNTHKLPRGNDISIGGLIQGPQIQIPGHQISIGGLKKRKFL